MPDEYTVPRRSPDFTRQLSTRWPWADTCSRTTVRAARHYAFPSDRLIFELTEGEQVTDVGRVRDVVRECQGYGLRVAIDDFGAGYAGLNLLADLTPDVVKLDMGLVRGIDGCRRRRAIVHGVMTTCRDLGIGVVAEGVETADELAALRDLGVRFAQGYLFARPAVEVLPEVRWPDAVTVWCPVERVDRHVAVAQPDVVARRSPATGFTRPRASSLAPTRSGTRAP